MHLPPEIWEIIESYIPIAEFYRLAPDENTTKQILEERGAKPIIRRFIVHNFRLDITVLANEYISKIEACYLYNDNVLFTLGDEGKEMCSYYLCHRSNMRPPYIMGLEDFEFSRKIRPFLPIGHYLHYHLFPRRNNPQYDIMYEQSKDFYNNIFLTAYCNIADAIVYPNGLKKQHDNRFRFTFNDDYEHTICMLLYYLAVKDRIWCRATHYMLYIDNPKIPNTLPVHCTEMDDSTVIEDEDLYFVYLE